MYYAYETLDIKYLIIVVVYLIGISL